MVHFLEDADGYAEKVYFDLSVGDNPREWRPLNDGLPILKSDIGTTGVRDPFLAFNPRTCTYYLIATDLRVFGGEGGNWDTWSDNASTQLLVWESTDLVEWSSLRTLDVGIASDELKGLQDVVTGEQISKLGMAWAPEATWVSDYYDLDEESAKTGGAFVVYWSSNPVVNNVRRNRIMWGATPDFRAETFSFGGVFVDNANDTIDTTILQARRSNGDLRTYRFSKENGVNGRGIYMESTDAPRWWRSKDWSVRQTEIGAEWAENNALGVEGPAAFADHNGKSWYLLVDVIPSVGYRPMVSENLDDGIPWHPLNLEDFRLRQHTKHGSVFSLKRQEYNRLSDWNAWSEKAL
jgi:hypothetical protein